VTDTEIKTAQGPLHSGSGDQYNFLPADWQVQFRRAARLVDAALLDWLDPRFIEPPDYGNARDKLEKSGLVFLLGQPGEGRQTAAMMLLHRSPDGRFHKLSDRPDVRQKEALDPENVEPHDRLLLDLTESDERTYEAIQRELSSFRATVSEQHARLVVVLPWGMDNLLDPQFFPLLARIGRPRGRAVVQRYLKADEMTFDPADLDADAVKVILDVSPMRDLAKFAELAQGTDDTGHRVGLRSAATALKDRAADVAKTVRSLQLGRQRAMLLTVAMLGGAPADTIFEANGKLLAATGHPIGRIPRLEQAGLGEELTKIGVTVSPSRRVRFTMLAYDEAVRAHFWDNFLDLRENLRVWTNDLVSANILSREDGLGLVSRFAEQALRTGRPQDLAKLTEEWTRQTNPKALRVYPLYAAKVLEAGLIDSHHGVTFREYIYGWSSNRNLSNDLAQVLVEVCVEVMARTHPERALVRLHHLSRLRDENTRAMAWDATIGLVAKDHRMFRRLVERVARFAARPDEIDLNLFLSVAGQIALVPGPIRDSRVRDQLSIGWRCVMVRPVHLWRASAREWLTASEDEKYREQLLDILVAGGGGEPKPLSELYRVARDWAAGRSASRRPVFLRVAEKINIAQGIDSEGTAR
jgi:hypothetical protein